MLKNGILLTGAAARISQEVAILDLLFADGLEINQDETLLVGYSSGAMNLLALNGCFCNDSKVKWSDYYKEKVLFKLKDKNVFELLPTTGRSILNTAPFRPFLGNILGDMGFSSYGELPFKSYVLTSQYHQLTTCWADNKNPGHGQLDPTDLFMASTSIPVVLPSQEIKNTKEGVDRDFPTGNFIDGGTWGAFKDYETQLIPLIKKNGALDELHIVSPMRESLDELNATKKELIKGFGLKHKAEVDYNEFKKSFKIGFGEFIHFVEGLNALNASKEIANEIYVSIPAMKKNTGILSFGKQEKTYKKVYDWLTGDGKDQFKVPIATFLKQNGK
jgi:hypothetical protein